MLPWLNALVLCRYLNSRRTLTVRPSSFTLSQSPRLSFPGFGGPPLS
jgi:hypothetical protein